MISNVTRVLSALPFGARMGLLMVCAGFALTSQGPVGGQEQAAGRLDSQLERVVQAFKAGGVPEGEQSADQLGLDAEGGAVRVIVEAKSGLGQHAARAAHGLGG